MDTFPMRMEFFVADVWFLLDEERHLEVLFPCWHRDSPG